MHAAPVLPEIDIHVVKQFLVFHQAAQESIASRETFLLVLYAVNFRCFFVLVPCMNQSKTDLAFALVHVRGSGSGNINHVLI